MSEWLIVFAIIFGSICSAIVIAFMIGLVIDFIYKRGSRLAEIERRIANLETAMMLKENEKIKR